MKSPWKGLSGMDAARAAMGQGWPFAACPWNGDRANGPEAKRRAGCRGKPFWFLLAGPAIRATAKRNSRSSAKQKYRKTRKMVRQVFFGQRQGLDRDNPDAGFQFVDSINQ